MMLDIISSLPLDWILNIAGVTKLEASFISALRINRLLRFVLSANHGFLSFFCFAKYETNDLVERKH